MISDALFWRGLNLCRAEPNTFVRTRLLTMYAIKSAPGELFEELLREAYATIDLLEGDAHAAMLQEVTVGLIAAGIL